MIFYLFLPTYHASLSHKGYQPPVPAHLPINLCILLDGCTVKNRSLSQSYASGKSHEEYLKFLPVGIEVAFGLSIDRFVLLRLPIRQG